MKLGSNANEIGELVKYTGDTKSRRTLTPESSRVLLPSNETEMRMVSPEHFLWHHKPIWPLNLSFTSKSQNLKSRLYAMGDEEGELLGILGITKSWS